MFSSRTDLWSTPQDLFDELNKEFNFDIDVCALPENAKCERYFSPQIDGLSQKWEGVCWCNPPYGREIGKWVEKAYKDAKNLVSKNKSTVEKLAKALLDKETLSGEEIREIVLGKKVTAKKKTTKSSKKIHAKK